ncbi:hypothetical protein J2T13_004028 [Paenibacillus sp. DS2015]|uniref:hypothetical protein n=1 Tax=Paenibacillus sp. DS2015 TaxID=3373917 RepID=UPI003D262920
MRLREERGSSLLMVLFLILLLTMLGLAVMGAAIGGAQRTQTRQNDVQSLHLAEKTLDETIAYITATLDGQVDISNAELDSRIDTFLSDLKDNLNGLSTRTKLVGGSSRITDITYTRDDVGTGNKLLINYVLTLTAEAEVNGVIRKLSQEVIIDTFPDFLKYAIGSQSNLTINGAPSIDGNLYAGKQFRISNTAVYTYKNNPNLSTSSKFPKLLNGAAYIQSLSEWRYSQDGEQFKIEDEAPAQMNATIQKILGISMDQVKIRNNREFVEINVHDSFIDKVTEAIGSDGDRVAVKDNIAAGKLSEFLSTHYSGRFVSITPDDLVKPEEPIKPEEPSDMTPEERTLYESKVAIYDQQMIVYEQEMDLYRQHMNEVNKPVKSTVYKGNLVLDGMELQGITYESTRNWFIVDGDLTIDHLDGGFIPIRANMLVTGNVLIRGEAEFDATVFVLGQGGIQPVSGYSTVLEDATIKGRGGSELVLISKGGILINRLEAFQSTPTELKAFFYTDQKAELYGVGSVFSLKGGFFAKGDLTINAVLGETKENSGGDRLDFDPYGNGSKPRFQVEYNQEVFEHQNIGLPRVNQINVRVGKMEMK